MTQELTNATQQGSALQIIDLRLTQMIRQNQQVNLQMAGMLRDMAAQMHAMSEQLADVTRQLADQAQRTPLSSQQRGDLTRAIRARATELAAANGWSDPRRINLISSAIRRAVRHHISQACGLSIRAMGDVPACQHEVVMQLVGLWDDWMLLDTISRGGNV